MNIEYVECYHISLEIDYSNTAARFFAQVKLQADIVSAAGHCETSIFVFDEVHKMPAGVLDSLGPFIGYASTLGGVNYRKMIFIFLGYFFYYF